MKIRFSFVAVAVAACTPANVEPAPPPTPSAEPAPSVTAPPPPSAEPEPPPPAEVPDASREHRPKVSSSPGQIECHDVVCDLATEVCCQTHGSGTCVPRDKPEGCGSLEVLWKYCDETPDCEKGSVCCYAPRPDPTVYATNVCRKKKCNDPEYENCLADGACSGKKSCRTSQGAYEGYCR